MNEAGWFVSLDTSLDEASCDRTWIADIGCFGLATDTKDTCELTGCTSSPVWIDDALWATLTDTSDSGKYGVDTNTFYTNAYECQQNHPDGDGAIDTLNIPIDGSTPACFYKIDVRQ
jgi:hypothetical protein